jgi:hypothetical protein
MIFFLSSIVTPAYFLIITKYSLQAPAYDTGTRVLGGKSAQAAMISRANPYPLPGPHSRQASAMRLFQRFLGQM